MRGLGREGRHFGDFVKVFARRFPGARVVVLDLPGVASAADHVAPLGVEAMVRDLRERFLALDLPGPRGLLGISLGGMCALEWVSRHPTDFEATLVGCASAANLSAPFHRLMPRNLGHLRRAARAKSSVERELALLPMSSTQHAGNRALAEEWAAYAEESPIPPSVVARQLGAGLRFRAPKTLPVPALFAVGARDRFVSPRCSERLAAHYRAPLAIHPEAGHDLSLDAPEWLADRAAALWKDLP